MKLKQYLRELEEELKSINEEINYSNDYKVIKENCINKELIEKLINRLKYETSRDNSTIL